MAKVFQSETRKSAKAVLRELEGALPMDPNQSVKVSGRLREQFAAGPVQVQQDFLDPKADFHVPTPKERRLEEFYKKCALTMIAIRHDRQYRKWDIERDVLDSHKGRQLSKSDLKDFEYTRYWEHVAYGDPLCILISIEDMLTPDQYKHAERIVSIARELEQNKTTPITPRGHQKLREYLLVNSQIAEHVK